MCICPKCGQRMKAVGKGLLLCAVCLLLLTGEPHEPLESVGTLAPSVVVASSTSSASFNLSFPFRF